MSLAPISNTASLSVAVTGSGGSGAVTTGLILLQAAARAGLYGLLTVWHIIGSAMLWGSS